MPRILGERNRNATFIPLTSEKPESDLEEWKAVHEVNRAEIGNNGSFLEFGEDAFDCLAEEEEENVLPPTAVAAQETITVKAADLEENDESNSDMDVEEEEEELEERRESTDASDHDSFENEESEVESGSVEIEFSVPSSPLPSSPEVVVSTPSVPLFSIEFTRERVSVTIGTRALWRVVKWAMFPVFAAVSYIYCPYLQHKVDKFIMEF